MVITCEHCGTQNWHEENDRISHMQCTGCGSILPCYPDDFQLFMEVNNLTFGEALEHSTLSLDNWLEC